jgi:hypothetical protein
MIKNQNKQTYNMVSLDDNEFQKLIYTIRGEQVMLDRDLAILYGVQTGRLNEQVKRNIKRFPERLMFQLTKEELNDWMSQIAISNKEKMGIRKMPFAFNEQGVATLSGVLTESRDPGAYWRKLKQRLNEENSEVVTNCHGLKMKTSTGKKGEHNEK